MNTNSTKQSSLRTAAALLVVELIAAVTLTLWTSRTYGRLNERALFWGIVLPWAFVARFPGGYIGSFLGIVARHAVGWFAAVITGAVTIIVLNYVAEPELIAFIVRLRTGLIPTAVVFGILAATIAESSLSLLEMVWRQVGQDVKPELQP